MDTKYNISVQTFPFRAVNKISMIKFILDHIALYDMQLAVSYKTHTIQIE